MCFVVRYLPLIAVDPDVRVFPLHHDHLRLPHRPQAALSLLLQLVLTLKGVPEVTLSLGCFSSFKFLVSLL